MKQLSKTALSHLRDELVPGGAVLRVRPLRGGVSCSVHAVWLADANGSRRTVVVRRFGQDWQEDSGVCRREFKLLEQLAQVGFAVPRPLLLDEQGGPFGAPTLVLTLVPGRSTLQPRNRELYLRQLAHTLAQMHQLPTAQLDFLPRLRQRLDRGIQRGGLGDDALEAEVRSAVSRMWPTIPDEAQLVHGDYWPGNTVFLRDQLSGVIDWEMAALGSPAKDVATCRCDLTNLFDLDTADVFTRMYEEASGRQVADLPFWDLQVATGALQYIDHWAEGYRALGRADLSGERAKESVRLFARAALAKTGD